MISTKTRICLFLFICVPVRLLLAYAIKQTNAKHLKYIGYAMLIAAALFILSYFNFKQGRRKGAFGGKIWWNDMRAVHGCVYLLFSLFAIKQNSSSWMILVIDVFIGLVAFLIQYKSTIFKIL
jgi:hypothetical protein